MTNVTAEEHAGRAAVAAPADSEAQFEQYRPQLTAFCYRMLGSAFEAEDAVQETLLRAWRNFDRFEGRSAVQTWLFRIASNVCLDMLKGAQRRVRSIDLGPAGTADSPLGDTLPEDRWLLPIPDSHILPAETDPAEAALT